MADLPKAKRMYGGLGLDRLNAKHGFILGKEKGLEIAL